MFNLTTIMCDLLFLFFVNLLTFVIYMLDKYLSVQGKWHITEVVLIVFAALGGAFGALCAMIFFNHKTNLRLFTICIPFLLYIQLVVEILYRTEIIFFN